ncbi:energy-coupling factor transporter transmembrane protein EcfT [Schumannella sp. 10F1B-5-1]|uniref:energy-coupling factor transporter transmembrane component T family protein n=1 Tax=Schumannella sp. 10F1B-5-1 TaxID=2590780 RepID=UPI0011310963|nr:energy-coupling factor transporter transmembrane component T [Schumannella sp. 10F1B-5-1]TPW70079.1 energy-coupling factor transporter transmembrane protein EcfT [Schumannella sp. 10F1B-5-1]
MSAIAARVAAVNPVARLLASVPLVLGLVFTIDPVSAGVALALELLLMPLTGIGWRRFWRVTRIVWIVAPLGAVTILLYGQASGAVLFSWAVVHVTEGSVLLAIASLLRVLAIALPAVVLFAGVDPTDLADGLGQVLRLPQRFVIGALAGLRMLALLHDDWRAITLARRARGLGDHRGPGALVRQCFGLLVLALRRGGLLATAMEARGFGGDTPRTWARPSRFGRAEVALIGVGALVAAVAVTAAVVTGSWRFIGG